MGQAVGLAEAFGRLGASELRYRTLTENANDAICILTRDGVIQEVNRRLTEIFGYPAERFIGRHIEDFAAPGHASENTEPYRLTVAGGDKAPQLYEIQKQDGEVGFVEFSTAAVEIEGRGLVFAIGRDVTERLQRARLLALTAAVGLSLNKGSSLTSALQGCADALVTHLGPALGRIWMLNEREGVLELRASAGLDMPLDDSGGRVRLGEHKIGRIAQNRTPHLTNSVVGDPEVRDQAWAQREGMVAFAGHPLTVDGRVVGVMALFARHPLSDAVFSALGSVADHVALGIERHRSAEALRTAEQRMRLALEAANVGIWDQDYTTGVLRWSETIEAHYGLEPGAFGGTFEAFVERIHPDDRQSVLDTVGKAMTSGADFSVMNRSIWPDGTVRWLSGAGRVQLGAQGEPVRGVGISLDVTERHTLEEQFQQAQKMEAVGQLAGGVAHDFNNLLTAILGFSNFVMDSFEVDDPRRLDIQEVIKAGERATTLTRQLLAFSRKQVLQPVAVDLNTLVAGLRKMLARLIGEHVDLVTVLAPDLRIVLADPGQLEQIVTNLVVNARDAMPVGGRVSIETANVELDESYAMQQRQSVRPGSYVMLAVSDSGTGMNEETKRRLFEPFFTTKEPGKGTGLGLATVYGIVKQSGGYIWVYSEPDAGTSFKVYLPVADQEHEVPSSDGDDAVAPGGTETVLVVEDEQAVRFVTRVILEKAGYRVFDAANPKEAEALFAENPTRFDLLVTDVIMPGSSGPKLFQRLVQVRSDLRVLYVSGYTNDEIVHRGQLDPGVAFLQKPFTAADLSRRVREVIDR
jgi:PAS domain S-box-containing protein